MILALFAFDMMFLPMFHIGGAPFKVGYLLLPMGLLSLRHDRSVRQLAGAAAALAAIGWLGAMHLWALEETAEFTATLRMTAILALLPLAYLFGRRYQPRSVGFLLWLMWGYCALTLVLSTWYRELPWLISFYGLDDRVTTGLFAVRSPGIHYNPNLSALTANLMLIAAVAGDRAGLLRTSSRLARIGAFGAVIATHFMLGSRGEAIASVVIGGFWLFYRSGGWSPARLLRFAALGTTAGVAVVLIGAFSLDYFAARSTAVAFVQKQLTSTLTIIPSDFNDPHARTNSILLRPFFEAERVFERVVLSPLWGTGFDRAAVNPFDNVHFHNDWALMLVGGGVLGFALFGFIVWFAGSVALVFVVPFLLSAPVNTFILAPSHVLFHFAFVGVVAAALERQEDGA
ncbi:MAG TPA: O-antigen ligase family protein [Vicinamibacterales bacterium]|nr:O-antigen ligase family protein [Vicinamibacterales bacterium]